MKKILAIFFIYCPSFLVTASGITSIDIYTLLGEKAMFTAINNNKVLSSEHVVSEWSVNSEINQMLKGSISNTEGLLVASPAIKELNEIKRQYKHDGYHHVNAEKLENYLTGLNSQADYILVVLPGRVRHAMSGLFLQGYGTNGHAKQDVLDAYIITRVHLFDNKAKKFVLNQLMAEYSRLKLEKNIFSQDEISAIDIHLAKDQLSESKRLEIREALSNQNFPYSKKIKLIHDIFYDEYGDNENYDNYWYEVEILISPLHHTPQSFPGLSFVEKSKVDERLELTQKLLVHNIAVSVSDRINAIKSE